MKSLLTIVFTTLLLNYATTLVSSQEPCNDTNINENSQPPDLQDSHVEHVKVKQRTGFDGKVRSIRFGIDSDDSNNDANKRQQVQKEDIDTTEPIFSSMIMDLDSSLLNDKGTTDTLNETTSIAKESSYETTTSNIIKLRKRRSINSKSDTKNHLNDLQAEEAKVFRPLFVYRHQVNKRLRPQNEKLGISGHGSQRIKSSSHRNYHPYRYSPYRYYPSG